MKKLMLILSICFSSLVLASQSDGIATAKDWLGIVDSGEYAVSWQKADPYFQSQLPEASWDMALKEAREPLGAVVSRTELGSKEYTSLPGVQDGEYLIIQFKTDFQNKKSLTETVTLSKSSGEWLPVGYFIK
ncbi:DUF4019 domain-containing protein [Vibrio cholerae]|uniref:DUF4019 domain-containing protein n=1 Tax=Vibrio cholerae TaxID=666 RepID=UPI001EC361A2|nr:DUF4019 domain-containing protein [Vibrio cholerae]EGQ7944484.1 DUF4019 domain-containing protein [Vibrio cholerae]MDV2397921.1 DUF4019 domain-containing protein [Vibrio cholerae]